MLCLRTNSIPDNCIGNPEFKQKTGLIKISASIIVQRETQKAIILGEGGKMIKKIGSEARKEIEKFVGQKVFLELF